MKSNECVLLKLACVADAAYCELCTVSKSKYKLNVRIPVLID